MYCIQPSYHQVAWGTSHVAGEEPARWQQVWVYPCFLGFWCRSDWKPSWVPGVADLNMSLLPSASWVDSISSSCNPSCWPFFCIKTPESINRKVIYGVSWVPPITFNSHCEFSQVLIAPNPQIPWFYPENRISLESRPALWDSSQTLREHTNVEANINDPQGLSGSVPPGVSCASQRKGESSCCDLLPLWIPYTSSTLHCSVSLLQSNHSDGRFAAPGSISVASGLHSRDELVSKWKIQHVAWTCSKTTPCAGKAIRFYWQWKYSFANGLSGKAEQLRSSFSLSLSLFKLGLWAGTQLLLWKNNTQKRSTRTQLRAAATAHDHVLEYVHQSPE